MGDFDFNAIITAVKDAYKAVESSGVIDKVVAAGKEYLPKIVDAVKEYLPKIIDAVKEYVPKIVDFIGGIAK